jgi:glycosyltransferase involved in cell wall biosynthesis
VRLLFITDNFPPEVNAPATRTYEHCLEWVKEGVDVTVITCAPNFPQGKVYDGYKNKLYQKEVIDGIKVIRVWSYITSNQGFLKRTIDFLSFAVSSFLTGWFVKTDIIIATSPQFFVGLTGRWLSFFKRKPWVFEVRDLWPESIKTVGALKDGFTFRALERLELKLYRKTNKIIPVTDSFKDNLISRGVESNTIAVIKNGANLDLYSPDKKDFELKESLGLSDKFLIGYIGTHGLAHKLDFILNSAKQIVDPQVHFLFVGSGATKADLMEQSSELRLENVTFLDPVEKSQVWRYISILNAMLVPLKKSDLFKTVIPSKIFETAAMEVPIILGVDGESRDIIEQYKAGLYYEPENMAHFIEVIMTMKEQPQLMQEFKKGCGQLAIDFDRKVLAKKMLRELQKEADPRSLRP